LLKQRDNRGVQRESEVARIRNAVDCWTVTGRCDYTRHALLDSQNGTRDEEELWKVD
jgi:hypothetical protein